MKKLLISLCGIILIYSVQAKSAEIYVKKGGQDGVSLIVIAGVIEAGDDTKFSNLIYGVGQAVVVLDSPGGAALPAIEMGKAIRLKGFTTIVPDRALCASACALMWLGGMPRILSDKGNLGFHATFIEKDGKLFESGVGNALVGRYLTLLNLPERAVIFVTNAPPAGMNWLTRANYNQSAIDTTFIGANPEYAVSARKKLDAIGITTAFYNYLSQGEGGAAAALIIPEKRGIGAFNEKNMTNYFSGMKERLKIVDIKSETDGKVSVSYVYTRQDGFFCSTTASVTTRESFELLMIEKITAKC